jgi:hypothetical protein
VAPFACTRRARHVTKAAFGDGLNPMENLALNRPALQSSTSAWSVSARAEIDASVANNGDTLSNRYFHTGREHGPWWQVDLEGFHLAAVA